MSQKPIIETDLSTALILLNTIRSYIHPQNKITNMKKSIILNLIMLLVVCISCSKDDAQDTSPDIYAVGTKFDESNNTYRAVLFKNGTETVLSTQSSYAYAMYVYQDDVYVVGQEKKSDGINHATIWKTENPQHF